MPISKHLLEVGIILANLTNFVVVKESNMEVRAKKHWVSTF